MLSHRDIWRLEILSLEQEGWNKIIRNSLRFATRDNVPHPKCTVLIDHESTVANSRCFVLASQFLTESPPFGFGEFLTTVEIRIRVRHLVRVIRGRWVQIVVA